MLEFYWADGIWAEYQARPNKAGWLPSQRVLLLRPLDLIDRAPFAKLVIAMTPSAIRIRRLEINDKRKGFIELLQQLSICDAVSDKDFEDRFQELSRCGDDHVICVIEDLESGKIVGTGSVFIEKKFLRNCGKVGHIEDVVVDGNARGMQLGKRVVEFLTEHARSVGCYKVILDCSDENVLFYDKCGFRRKEVQMAKYF